MCQRLRLNSGFAGLALAALCALAAGLAAPPATYAQACSAGAIPPPSGALVAWYPFDEAAGPTSANLATQDTGLWTSAVKPIPVPGVVGNGLSFSGNNFIDTPSSIVTNFGPAHPAACHTGGDDSSCQGDFSMDVWIDIAQIPSIEDEVYTIADKRTSKRIHKLLYARGYSFYLYGDYTIPNAAAIGVQLGDSTGYTNYSSPSVLPIGGWHHVAITVQRTGSPSGVITWYLDGAPVGTAVPTQTGSLVNDAALRIGAACPELMAAGFPYYFIGSMDELQIFNRALTPAEVAAIYAAGASGQCKP